MMSIICMKKNCKAHSGMCIHDKLMLGIAFLYIIAAGATGHWMLHRY